MGKAVGLKAEYRGEAMRNRQGMWERQRREERASVTQSCESTVGQAALRSAMERAGLLNT